MNAVEIEQAVTDLAAQPFDAQEFPFAFLTAFGNKKTTIDRLRTGATNKSDVQGVLQHNNIHIKVSEPGLTGQALCELRDSPRTARGRVKFILATDGIDLEAEDMSSGETVACRYEDFPDQFGFFLPLAGISTVRAIRENAFDVRATSRLNRLYVELLKDNPEWAEDDRREEMNHFMARLIFCFFAEDTDIFEGEGLFTDTVLRMSSQEASNVHEVIGEIFRAMDVPRDQRAEKNVARWALPFPYANGELFGGEIRVPRFSRIARSYLSHIGQLDWTKINPDIFGSMIQAIADEEERGGLGMHYTSVPNILKVLNPLFLDDLRQALEEAETNSRKLLNLRKRIAHIRVFDPACGSGNFLVIAYKHLRELENTINERRKEPGRPSDIRLTNFRGIELRHFSAEIARLALIIAEYQCDVMYRGAKLALAEFLPLDNENWIARGNALKMDWLSVCPPSGTRVEHVSDELFVEDESTGFAEVDFENEGGEVYICGNPPYLGSTWQSKEQKAEMQALFHGRAQNWKSLDYVAGWFIKAADYCRHAKTAAAFVATNSICQGQQVPILWPLIFKQGCEIQFAHTSFKWANLASYNAGVTVAIIGISGEPVQPRRLFELTQEGETIERRCDFINAYLVAGPDVVVERASRPLSGQAEMLRGNIPYDSGHFLMTRAEMLGLGLSQKEEEQFVRRIYGSAEFIRGTTRYCLWIKEKDLPVASTIPVIKQRIDCVQEVRLQSKRLATYEWASKPHRFGEVRQIGNEEVIVVPRVSAETREYLPVGLLEAGNIVSDRNFALFDAPLWNMALIASRLHWVWIGNVCVRLRTDFSYSNTLGWNTFPIPLLTEQNKIDLTRCAEDILLAREAHYPATIADLYAPDKMPANLRAAHERNDEVIERIYIGRRFRNDTERLEKLFDMYSKMVAKNGKRS